jgi:hypothetical protein
MEKYFNQSFGRSDSSFSKYEGPIASNILGELYCDDGVVIQDLPTGKKTCTGAILYEPTTTKMRWYTDNTIANCFVTQ